MIEIDIPTIDPIQHEPKVFLGMNKRQILCAVPGAAAAIGLALLFKNISLDMMVVGVIIGVAPAVLFGWIKPYNMPFEKYLKLLYENNFVNSPKRIYKTDNAEDVKMLTIKEREALEKKQHEAEMAKKRAAATAAKTSSKLSSSNKK